MELTNSLILILTAVFGSIICFMNNLNWQGTLFIFPLSYGIIEMMEEINKKVDKK